MTDTDDMLARRVVALLDLTSLNVEDDEARIDALCHRALTPLGPVAAVCVYPRFVALARRTLDALGGAQVRVATVCNFPGGEAMPDAVLAEVDAALEAGADEIDLVYPYRTLMAGDEAAGSALVGAVKARCQDRALLKVILETGELRDLLLVRRASEAAIAAGADFIKTSTGKVPVNATAAAAEVMLDVIAATGGRVGFKPAGGMRSVPDALVYLWLAERLLGSDWPSPMHLRFGASSLLDDVLRRAGVGGDALAAGGY